MSNATQDSRNSGDKRRRSRGGRNRRNHQNRNGDRNQRGDQNHQGNKPQRAEEFRPQGNRQRKFTPPKLTWWQKLLKAIGLYKEPVRPPRPERKPDVSKQKATPADAKVKSNTRNARSGDGQNPQGEKRERGERNDRNRNRDHNRNRGGDAASVESSRVYVGNLSYDVSESDLTDLFKGIGGVRNVEIVYNRTTHRSKGYGFVEMLHVDEAKRAVEVLHDQPFMGRKMTVSGAKSKGQDEREEREERAPREPRQQAPESHIISPAVPVATAPTSEVTPAATPVVEVVTHLQDPTPAEMVEAAVENVEAVGAPEVIVEAVEHQVADAVDAESSEEPKQA